jgi:hypothetical protein
MGNRRSDSILLAVIDIYKGWKIPKVVYTAFLGIGLFVACFQAWQDQYRQNEAAR